MQEPLLQIASESLETRIDRDVHLPIIHWNAIEIDGLAVRGDEINRD